jgi:hypothetical protein
MNNICEDEASRTGPQYILSQAIPSVKKKGGMEKRENAQPQLQVLGATHTPPFLHVGLHTAINGQHETIRAILVERTCVAIRASPAYGCEESQNAEEPQTQCYNDTAQEQSRCLARTNHILLHRVESGRVKGSCLRERQFEPVNPGQQPP